MRRASARHTASRRRRSPAPWSDADESRAGRPCAPKDPNAFVEDLEPDEDYARGLEELRARVGIGAASS